jgi:hypothetical protein
MANVHGSSPHPVSGQPHKVHIVKAVPVFAVQANDSLGATGLSLVAFLGHTAKGEPMLVNIMTAAQAREATAPSVAVEKAIMALLAESSAPEHTSENPSRDLEIDENETP